MQGCSDGLVLGAMPSILREESRRVVFVRERFFTETAHAGDLPMMPGTVGEVLAKAEGRHHVSAR